MTVGDLRQYIEGDEDEILRTAERLEEQGSVMALRDRKNGGIRLVKATYEGLAKPGRKKTISGFLTG